MTTVKLKADLGAAFQFLGELDRATREALRPAAKAGSDVIYEQVKSNAGKINKVTGNLASSIYQAFSEDQSGPLTPTYNISWRTGRNTPVGEDGKKPAALGYAPHGHLVEYGHIQRYVVYLNKKGQWRTAIRPEMRGKPKPGRRASQAQKDAYYVLLPGGPKQVPAQPFVRPAVSAFPRAEEAMVDRFFEVLQERGVLT